MTDWEQEYDRRQARARALATMKLLIAEKIAHDDGDDKVERIKAVLLTTDPENIIELARIYEPLKA